MMNNSQLATASLDDIVFDGRNKAYGAYVLRGEYDRHVTRALIIATALFLLLISFPVVARLLEDDVTVRPPHVFVDANPILIKQDEVVVQPVQPKEVVQPKTRVEQATTVKYDRFKVVPNDKAVTNDVPDQRDLAVANPGTVTYTNPNPGDILEPLTEEPKTDAPTAGIVAPTVYTYVEQMPSLPGGGGMGAVVSAIQKAVKYPAIDVRNGVEGRVFASFTVNSQGEVTDVKIVKGLSSTLDEETIRAIKTLPRFIPGKQNGREVSVSFTVPITYKIQ